MDLNIIFSIVPRLLPTFILGLVALLGLVLQRKTFSEIITGTVKTMAGVIILFCAVDLIGTAVTPISEMFAQIYQYKGAAATADWTAFLANFGFEVVLIMVFGFIVNLILARITKWKYVFLTGHIMFWNAFMVTAALADGGKLSGIPLIVIGSIVLGFILTLLPAMISPFVFKLTGNKDFTIGHSTTIISVIGAYLGKWFGDPKKSTEDSKISDKWSFMKSMTVSTTLVMFVLFIVLGLISGWGWTITTYGAGSTLICIFALFYKAILFGASLTILLTGVRMMLAEITPAFKGLADKVVPNAIPALDCPMIFPYGQNALTIGFPIAVISSMVALVIFGLTGYPYMLLPTIVAAFFDVGPACILANSTGGRRGVIITAIVGGFLMIAFQAAALPFVMNSAAGFVNLYGGNDFGVIAVVVGGIAKLFGF
ncbi:MAG: PTS ascorbate transporter subunit IIC [Pelolinea sp.]|jgi:PTS system ascorbate-specific IIC component|nr:PTS ascorbate transporter subunit IIC [Pelolinea sp.]